jgi:DNA-binding response OmpR family regulator
MLTAKNQTSDIISSLDAGADDYLTKPFSFEELLARIRALTRRPHALSRDIIQVSDLTIDRTHYVVMRGAKTIILSQREYALLEYLARHMNQVVAKERLIQDVWEFDADILPNTVEAYIRKLREKIDIPFPSSSPLIHTVRGFGYKLAPST